MKIAHLFPDNTTFPANFMHGLRKFGHQKSNIIFIYFKELPDKLKSFEDFDIRLVSSISQLKDDLKEMDRIVFHSLYPHYLRIIPRLSDKHLSWVFWGYEYYNYFETNLYEPKTKRLVPGRSILKKLAQSFRKFQLMRAMKHIDSFLFWDASFFQQLKSKFQLKAKFEEFLYCRSFLDPIDSEDEKSEIKNKLVCYVGNSGELTGNQPDVYSVLAKTDGIEKVYSLLAYGKSNHIKIIERSASQQLGLLHVPIKEFVPFDEYLQTMNEVDIIICNHNRMQALGLIFNAILLEKILILNPKNHFEKVLSSIGVKVYQLNDIPRLLNKNTSETRLSNKKALLDYFNPARLREYYCTFK